MTLTISGTTLTWNDSTTQTVGGYTLVPGMTNKWTAPSRAAGTTYTNSTGYPLAVIIGIPASGSCFTTFNINGTTIFNPYYSGSSGCYMVNAIVPSIKWKSYPGDDGKYYESEEVKYIKFGLANRMIRAESEDNYRGFTLLGLDVGIGTKTQTEQII